jgi:V/A-type H+-transporting ATPase subunit E
LDHFKSLKGSDLLSFVVKQIQDEKIKGDEIMRVNARDYERYRLALSSQDLAHNVVLDRLNKALGKDYHLVLEDVSSNEEEGFLLLGDIYDLNFSVKPILDRLRKRKEKELFASLFENEGE